MPRYFNNDIPHKLLELLEKIQNELGHAGFTAEEIVQEGFDGYQSSSNRETYEDAFGRRKTVRQEDYMTEPGREARVRRILSQLVAEGFVALPEEGSEEYSLTERGRDIDISSLLEASR